MVLSYETYPLLPPAGEDVTEINSSETYGALKVTCENIVQKIYEDEMYDPSPADYCRTS